jgi:cell division protein FtsL
MEEGRVNRLSGPSFVALAVAALLAALSLVAWRQSRALEALAELEHVRRETALVLSEKVELERRIQFLESRQRVVPEARATLGMHTPDASEMIFLHGEPE